MGCGDCAGGIVRGASGLVKVGLQALGVAVDQAPDQEIRARREQCRDCEFATRNSKPRFAATKGLSSLSQCRKCRCVIAAKTQVASETCPLPAPRWGPVTPRP